MNQHSFLGIIEQCIKDTSTTEIYTLSLHDALPISQRGRGTTAGGLAEERIWARWSGRRGCGRRAWRRRGGRCRDRKSTRLNSSHVEISYAVFCLKKKNRDYARDIDRLHDIFKLAGV